MICRLVACLFTALLLSSHRHYIHSTEFVFKVLYPSEEAKTITVRRKTKCQRIARPQSDVAPLTD